jgi:adenosine kinase
MNLSAPFLCQFFKEPMDQTAPYWDILFGNNSEAEAYADSHELNTKSIKDIAKHIVGLPKANSKRQRVVVITQGADPTIVARGQENGQTVVTEIPTAAVLPEDIVDTNGAGDAFAGGFMAEMILGGEVSQAVKVGQWLAGLCLRCNGPAYSLLKGWTNVDIPSRSRVFLRIFNIPINWAVLKKNVGGKSEN